MHRSFYGVIGVCFVLFVAACTSNQRPELQPVAAQTAYVGQRVDVVLRAFDPDADRLVYNFAIEDVKPSARTRITNLLDQAIFSWTPIAEEVGLHQVDFSVSDGHFVDVESSTIDVKPEQDGETAPKFILPIGDGTTLDMQKTTGASPQNCLSLDVLVEDSDSVEVTIRQSPPLPGAELVTTGTHAAEFSWCPSAEQARSNNSEYVLTLEADDNDHAPVRKIYRIVIIPPTSATGDGGISDAYQDAGPGDAAPGPDVSTVPTAPIFLDFEKNNGGLVGTKDWEWGIALPTFQPNPDCSPASKPPAKAYSGNLVWGTKLSTCYSALGNQALSCNNQDLSDDSTLSFKVKIPSSWATAMLRYQAWEDFFVPHDWSAIYVEGKSVFQQCKGTYSAPTQWITREVDLSAWRGKEITIAFHFMASGIINYAGWYIDDVAVVGK